MPGVVTVTGLMRLGAPVLADGCLWTPESPVLVGVLQYFDRANGGAYIAASQAFSGARSRVTYMLVRPSVSRSYAAFRWPSAQVAGEVLHSAVVMHSPRDDDISCRPLAIGVWVIDLDTFLAPQFLPGWLRPRLASCPRRRVVRLCRCLLMRRRGVSPLPDEPYAHLTSLFCVLGPELQEAEELPARLAR